MQHISDPLLQAYIDGFCNEERIDEIEAHVYNCAECRVRLESARDVAQRASQLLGALDPGPVHAPSFEELQARAAARMADGSTDLSSADAAVDATANAAGTAATDAPAPPEDATPMMPGAIVNKAAPVVPLWRRPAMVWAATLVVAFGLGWLARAPEGLAPDLSAPATSTPEMPSADRLGAEASATEQDAPGEAGMREGFAGGDEIDDEIDNVQAAAKQMAVAEPEVDTEVPAPATTTAAMPEEEAVRRQAAESRLAQNQAVSADPPEVGAASRGSVVASPPTVAAAPPADAAALPPVSYEQAQAREMNERLDERVNTFADAGVSSRFVPVAPEAAASWLGAAPREIPDLTLVRVEVAPGALAENGVLDRIAVRLVYVADTGQEITLLQQYTGPMGLQGPATLEEAPAGAGRAAEAPARQERARAAGEFRAEGKVSADRDAVVGGLVDLPVTVRGPDGRVTYRWLDAEGYVLSISGDLDPDVLRGLAGRVR